MSSPFLYFDLNDFLNISERRLLISCKFLPTNLSNMLTRTLFKYKRLQNMFDM